MGKKTKVTAAILGLGLIIALGVGYYMFNMPQRDVQNTKTDYTLNSAELVNEYLNDAKAANEKYLQEEGDSKILAITGTIAAITTDLNDQKVVLLKDLDHEAGVRCTFTTETNTNAMGLLVGETTTIKGVIRSGAGYDEDLGLYEDVIMEKCDVLR